MGLARLAIFNAKYCRFGNSDCFGGICWRGGKVSGDCPSRNKRSGVHRSRPRVALRAPRNDIELIRFGNGLVFWTEGKVNGDRPFATPLIKNVRERTIRETAQECNPTRGHTITLTGSARANRENATTLALLARDDMCTSQFGNGLGYH